MPFYYKDDETLESYNTTKDDIKKKPFINRIPTELPELIEPDDILYSEKELSMKDFTLITYFGI